MKKILFVLLAVASLQVTAQEKPKVTSAIIAYRANELAEAKQFIDEATEIIDGKSQAEWNSKIMVKFYYNKALIYSKIAASSDESVSNLDKNANMVAAQSLVDLVNYEKQLPKPKYTDDAFMEIPSIAYNFLVAAGQAYEMEDFDAAYDGYINAFEFKNNEAFGANASLDTNLLFNAGIIANQAGNVEAAIEIFERCLALDYKGIQFTATSIATGQVKGYPTKADMEREVKIGLATDPQIGEDQRPSIYISLLNAYKSLGNTEGYENALTRARAAFPENKTLLDVQLQTYLDKKDYDGALANLDEAIAKNPDKAIYPFVKGTILQTQLKNYEAALAAYSEAIALDSTMSDAWYMCGLVYVDKANELSEQINNLGLNENRKYEKLKAQQKDVFIESMGFFEKAFSINPKDIDTIRALQEVYRKTGDYQKSMDMQKLLDDMSTTGGVSE